MHISAMNWLALSQMVEVLKPFLETMVILCGYTTSLEQVIPLNHALDQSLETLIDPWRSVSTLLPWTRALVKMLQTGVQKDSILSTVTELTAWPACVILESRGAW